MKTLKFLFAAAAVAAAVGGAGAPARAATLLHLYGFDADVSDGVGGANGTLVNGATVGGGVLNLDGVNDYVQFSSHLVPTAGSYSVALFGRELSRPSSIAEMISQGSSGGPGFYVGRNGNNVRATDSWEATGIAFPADTLRHHYALVVDALAGTSQFYIDGTLRGTINSAITTTAGGTDTRFGGQFAPFGEFFHGTLDDVRIYSGALTGGEVQSLALGITAVPEPGTLSLAGAALAPLLLLSVRRRRRSHA